MQWAYYLVLASAFAVACADSPTAYSGTTIGRYAPPTTAVLSGRIIVSGIGSDRIVELRDDHGDVFRLLGQETIALANVDSGDAVVWGTWDANPGFVVSEFKVIGMHGRPALDGVLDATVGGFVLRFKDGSLTVVPYLTPDCVAYLGARIWVVGFDDGRDVQVGVIARAES